jgi:large subunit ribosomal protein LP0
MADARKQAYFAKLIELLDKYPRLLIVGCNNVGSSHMQQIRKNLRGKAVLLMGKNTMIRKAIKGHLIKNPALEALLPHLKENVGFVFTDGSLNDVRAQIEESKVSAPARAGSIAPVDVIIPAGPTGLDPSQTVFMQTLNIGTKINKGQIDIMNDIHLIKKGDKVGQSEATVCQKLNINPFKYGLIPRMVYDGGVVFPPSILDINDSDVISKFRQNSLQLTALSLAAGIPTISSVPHNFVNAFRKLVAISLETEITFERVANLKQLLSNPEALAAAQAAAAAASAPTAAAPAAAAKEEKKVEKKEEKKEEEPEEDEAGFGGLFD